MLGFATVSIGRFSGCKSQPLEKQLVDRCSQNACLFCTCLAIVPVFRCLPVLCRRLFWMSRTELSQSGVSLLSALRRVHRSEMSRMFVSVILLTSSEL